MIPTSFKKQRTTMVTIDDFMKPLDKMTKEELNIKEGDAIFIMVCKDGLLHTAANSPDPQVGANMLISYFVANPEAMRIFSNAIEFANNELNKRRTNLN